MVSKPVVKNYGKYVYTPLEVANAGYNGAKFAIENAAFGFDFPHIEKEDIGEYFARLLPWEICAILGQTHNGKTTFVDWWEHAICRQFQAEKRPDLLVHISVEESLEAMSFYQHARYLGITTDKIATGKIDLKQLEWSVTQIAGVDIYRVADSSQNRDEETPELYLSNIYRMVRDLRDGKVTGEPKIIGGVIVDYLQALPYDPETRKESEDGKRRIQVRKDVYRLREMATHLSCPIIVNVQAKQKLEGANPPLMIPGMYDGEETASIAQRFDRIISLWMPKTCYPVGSEIRDVGTVAENGIYVKINKQRGGLPSGKFWRLQWDYKKHDLISLYTHTQETRDKDHSRDASAS
jgi:replicative DNA helicase